MDNDLRSIIAKANELADQLLNKLSKIEGEKADVAKQRAALLEEKARLDKLSADPWLAAVPGSYAEGTAGYVIGNWAAAPADPWDVELPGSYTGNKAGKILKRILDDTGYIAAK